MQLVGLAHQGASGGARWSAARPSANTTSVRRWTRGPLPDANSTCLEPALGLDRLLGRGGPGHGQDSGVRSRSPHTQVVEKRGIGARDWRGTHRRTSLGAVVPMVPLQSNPPWPWTDGGGAWPADGSDGGVAAPARPHPPSSCRPGQPFPQAGRSPVSPPAQRPPSRWHSSPTIDEPHSQHADEQSAPSQHVCFSACLTYGRTGVPVAAMARRRPTQPDRAFCLWPIRRLSPTRRWAQSRGSGRRR